MSAPWVWFWETCALLLSHTESQCVCASQKQQFNRKQTSKDKIILSGCTEAETGGWKENTVCYSFLAPFTHELCTIYVHPVYDDEQEEERVIWEENDKDKVRWDSMCAVLHDYPQNIYATSIIQMRLGLSPSDEPTARLDNLTRCWNGNHLAFGSYESNESNISWIWGVQVQK